MERGLKGWRGIVWLLKGFGSIVRIMEADVIEGV